MQFRQRISWFLGTGLGVGLMPIMPGTVGSLWGPPLVWTLQAATFPAWTYAGIALMIFLLGIPICTSAARQLGSPDPGAVVFDEIAAFPLVFAVTPVTLQSAVVGFVWFRVFDVWKPWPARRAERLHGGLGIMLDDQVAAVYAALALWLTLKFWP
ncbi:MAG: phosphatidylglycerophosphatase A [Planctomycetaceae bacterium]